MARKLPNPLKLFSAADAKTRVFVLFAGAFAVGLVGFLIFRYLGGGAETVGPSRVATAPGSLQSVPGAQMTPEFYRAVMQANVQSAQQAQISGGSAVPTLVNIPGQQPGPSQECTVICPSDENANVADDINNLMKQGKLSEADGNRLLELAKNNASVEEYAAALNELVRQGKLTPEQARALLNKYKKQHANALKNESAQFMDALVKSGQLPVEVADQLLELQKRGVSPAEYAAELQRLVREGKISPETAAQLLAQYTQQQKSEQAKDCVFALRTMSQAGAITADVANQLTALQTRNVPIDQYVAELERLVREGKLTPATSTKLSDQYRQCVAGLGPGVTLDGYIKQHEAEEAALTNSLIKNNKLGQAEGQMLLELEKRVIDANECKTVIDKLIADNKLTAPDAQLKLTSCQKLVGMRLQAKKLANLQANNASLEEYTNELKKAVAAGLLTPEQAAALLDQYRAIISPPLVGAGIGPETALPGAEGFAAMQSRLATTAPAPAAPVFVAPPPAPPPPPVRESQEDILQRQQRIEALQAAMNGQAQSLIGAWGPSVMMHREGTYTETVRKEGETQTETTTTTQTGGAAAIAKPKSNDVLIKAGTIAFAILDTTVDSDYPDTPVMATIIDGPLKGARLLGKLSLAQGKDRVSLNFNLINRDEWTTSKTVNAFAIDPDTARTVMASSVNYHYLKRFGAIMATSFLQGYSTAITNEGTSTTGIFGTSSTHPALSPGNKIAVGLGQIGTTLGGMVAKYIDTPATVKVNSGVGLGILFMADVVDEPAIRTAAIVPTIVPTPVPTATKTTTTTTTK